METCLKRATLILTMLTIVVMLATSYPRNPIPPKKPVPRVDPPMLVNTAYHQVTTAYTELTGAPPTASGQPYFIGAAAVHPRIPGGSHLEPIIPFGTVIRLINPKYITVDGQRLNAFTVVDTGDADWALWPASPYWFDIYFGAGGYWSNKAARDYGKQYVDYYWKEEIK